MRISDDTQLTRMCEFGGIAAMVLSVLIMIYSLVVYRVRTLRMYSKSTMRFDDTFGPQMLTFAAIIMLVLMALLPLYNYIFGAALTPITFK